MTYDEMIPIFDEMWKQFDFLFAAPSHPAYWSQEPYRSDFFRAFRKSYAIRPIHGDEVVKLVSERYLERHADQYDEKLEVLREICSAWSEWLYAWEQHNRNSD